MKKIMTLLTCALIAVNLQAQKANPSAIKEEPKVDVLVKTNGDELTGKVTEIGDTDVRFSYAGESLVYSIKKSDISKITFASGRIEFFNQPGQNGNRDNAEADHSNKVAVLPFGFIKDNQDAGEEMRYKVQEDVYTFLNKHSNGLTLLDPRTTNTLLAKAGVNRDNLMGFTMDEICNILGVEYVVEGTVTQTRGMATTSTYGGYNGDKKDGNRKGSIFASSMSAQRYKMGISINIYTDRNSTLFSQSRTGLLTTINGSYSSPMEYLLKRCPLYKK